MKIFLRGLTYKALVMLTCCVVIAFCGWYYYRDKREQRIHEQISGSAGYTDETPVHDLDWVK